MIKTGPTYIRGENGFTLIEIISVLVILGILTAAAMPKFVSLQEQAHLKVLETAFAAASSNVNMSFSKFLLKYGEKPVRITGGGSSNYSIPQLWVGSGGQSIPIERILGDFFVRYDYNPPGYRGKTRIQILATGPYKEELAKIPRNPDRMKWLELP